MAGRFRGGVSAPVPSSAVACPSGLRSTPRKRVWAEVHPGFESLRHRQQCQRDIDRQPEPSPARAVGRSRPDGPRMGPSTARWRPGGAERVTLAQGGAVTVAGTAVAAPSSAPSWGVELTRAPSARRRAPCTRPQMAVTGRRRRTVQVRWRWAAYMLTRSDPTRVTARTARSRPIPSVAPAMTRRKASTA